MGFAEDINGDISPESGSSVTYLPIMRSHKIEPAALSLLLHYPTSAMATFHLVVALYPSSRTQKLV